MFEIMGLDNTPSDMDGGPARHREDFKTLSEARAALADWQSDGRAAWIVEKDTDKTVF